MGSLQRLGTCRGQEMVGSDSGDSHGREVQISERRGNGEAQLHHRKPQQPHPPCHENTFDKSCIDHLKLLEAANAASQKMTSHETADTEVAALRERYAKVKAVSDEWVNKVDILVKEWT